MVRVWLARNHLVLVIVASNAAVLAAIWALITRGQRCRDARLAQAEDALDGLSRSQDAQNGLWADWRGQHGGPRVHLRAVERRHRA